MLNPLNYVNSMDETKGTKKDKSTKKPYNWI